MLGLRKLELRLKETPYLTGETMTIADLVIASCLRSLFMLVFGEVERKNSPSMSAWVTNLYSSVGEIDGLTIIDMIFSSVAFVHGNSW